MTLRSKSGYTVLELIIYVSLFALIGTSLVGVLSTAIKVQNNQGSTGEVSGQLDLVFRTVSRLVRESSNIEKVYEGNNESAPCSTYCSVKLRMSKPSEDPTIVRSDQSRVYLRQGTGAESELTSSKVSVDSFILAKNEISGGHAVLDIDLTLRYVSANPAQALARSISGAVGRVSAATFDDHLLPNTSGWNLGSSTTKWNDGWFSGSMVIEGALRLGNSAAPVGTSLYVPSSGYLQFSSSGSAAPAATDCDQDTERGRLYINTSTNQLYLCNGATRGWDKVNLTD